ncbi:hypothetical protein BGW38_000175 [Lunasporangiospora selenospora]|uniref:30S ribosomal protein S11 n=1 Tax=Lunasporangiospora selenospora TaxID=979761 RepID=A0A9P6FV86_9FUNG|nr:hypothetical protein BGW38_000175 [Lunasporangiospora selenospora]
MLSVFSRHALARAATSTRHTQAQAFTGIRSYSSENNDSKSGKREGAEALMNILSSSAGATQGGALNQSKDTATTTTSRSSEGASVTASGTNPLPKGAELILETLAKASQQQRAKNLASGNLINSRNTFGREGAQNQSGGIFGETQTATHNLHIHASMNNTILTLTDSAGDPITTQSAGSAGLKKAARAGPEAGYQAMTKLIEKVEEKNVQIQTLHVLLRGFGPGRDSAFRALRAKTAWDIKRISDTTPIPFNGCRPPKPRRL